VYVRKLRATRGKKNDAKLQPRNKRRCGRKEKGWGNVERNAAHKVEE
jgi:hypothetical protein